MTASLGEDSDPQTSPKGVEDGCDDGKNYEMGGGPKTPKNDNFHSEMLDNPSPIEPLQSTPRGNSGCATGVHRHDPEQQRQSIEIAVDSSSASPAAPSSSQGLKFPWVPNDSLMPSHLGI
ncbi:hypothetical protein H9Q74_014441 [Fusarium xylarioides]|nr:hypothetical protein H9Q71_013928 [Fusarium xylarioides]KAG5808198.1 hypothetical protein H9Q74_014441 [Fusarium xylarioides]